MTRHDRARTGEAGLMSGFGSWFETEAIAGALPVGRNSPQRVAFGLYAEQFSGSGFTAPRIENRHSWLYRIRPSVAHPAWRRHERDTLLRTAPLADGPVEPNRFRWDPLPFPEAPADFVDGLVTYATNGDVTTGAGTGIHLYAANRSMEGRAFQNSDGELLLVPQDGRLRLTTEMGVITLKPQQIAVIPRGIKFRVDLPDSAARGYICENYGAMFRLPELGPIGSNGLANVRDFAAPVAAFTDSDSPCEIIQKFQGQLWAVQLDHEPFDVVAWHGNLAPYTYDLRRFNALNTVSFDHPDPSIFTVLTSPGEIAGAANVDFVIFPPRWVVAEDTFRPPWFHRNVMSEFMGLIIGRYDAKAEGFVPGGASLHNQMSAHGPDRASYEGAIAAELAPQKIENTLAFMFESRAVLRPTQFAMETSLRQRDYDQCWDGFRKAVLPRH